MISSGELTNVAYEISNRFEAINSYYLQRVAEQIKEIGKLGPANLHRLQQMARMNNNIDEINRMLAMETGRSLQDIYAIYNASGLSVYGDYEAMYTHRGISQLPFDSNRAIQNYIESVRQLTQGTFLNMANTTVIDNSYRNLVDLAIDAVATGQTDYTSAIRQQLADFANTGISVTYASGNHRRLDSAIRMNILEGIRRVNDGIREQVGREFGADGVEISVHALCAKDHINIQGNQYAKGDVPVKIDGTLYDSFNVVNGNLKRKIATCNCKHTIFPIILGISAPAYTKKELKAYKDNSEQNVTLITHYLKDGTPKTITCTKYEATQYQRNLETEVRRAKDRYIVAEASGDDKWKSIEKQKIKSLRKTYAEISRNAGLEPKWDRMYVQGYTGKQTKPKPIKITSNISTTTSKPKDIKQIRQDALDKLQRLGNNPQALDVIIDYGQHMYDDIKEEMEAQIKAKADAKKLYDEQKEICKKAHSNLVHTLAGDGVYITDAISLVDSELANIENNILYYYNRYKENPKGRWASTFMADYEKNLEVFKSKYAGDKNEALWNALLESNMKLDELGEAYRTLKKGLYNEKATEITTRILSQYRDIGYSDATKIAKHLNNGRSPMRKVVEEAYQHYPTGWILDSIIDGNLTVKKVSRGYYSHSMAEIAISGSGGQESLETAFHELGHRFERTQGLTRYEKMFYNKRCGNEPLVWMGAGYDKDEKTRVDNWLSKYMGKDYGGYAYEICSMGFEYAYTDLDLLMKDEEFAKFTFGLLSLV